MSGYADLGFSIENKSISALVGPKCQLVARTMDRVLDPCYTSSCG